MSHSPAQAKYTQAVIWTLMLSCAIVAVAASLARAMLNIKAALTDKPDLAIFLLLEEEKPTQSVLLRETEVQRDYLVETEEGPKLVKLQKGTQWYVTSKENLRGD